MLDPNSFPRIMLGDLAVFQPVELKIPFGTFTNVGTGSALSAGVIGTEGEGFNSEGQA